MQFYQSIINPQIYQGKSILHTKAFECVGLGKMNSMSSSEHFSHWLHPLEYQQHYYLKKV